MYALRIDDKKDTKKVKDVKSNVVAKSITFDDYTRCLFNKMTINNRVTSKLHKVYTIFETKIALSPHDDIWCQILPTRCHGDIKYYCK